MILVTGATGNVGREVVQEVLQAGKHVRVLTRSPEKCLFLRTPKLRLAT